jgi:hypothetical protein
VIVGDDGTQVEVLIPTRNRPGALAVTLATLIGQQAVNFKVIVSDRSDGPSSFDSMEIMSSYAYYKCKTALLLCYGICPGAAWRNSANSCSIAHGRRMSCFSTTT